jgi:excisionase family DNA binding protein
MPQKDRQANTRRLPPTHIAGVAMSAPADAGVYLGVHPKTAIRMARERTIPALRVGEKHWRFRKSDLVAWVDQQIKSPRQPESE